MTASFSIKLFGNPLVRENDYRIIALSGETNTIQIPAMLSYGIFFLVGLLEAMSKGSWKRCQRTFPSFLGCSRHNSSFGKSVVKSETSGTRLATRNSVNAYPFIAG